MNKPVQQQTPRQDRQLSDLVHRGPGAKVVKLPHTGGRPQTSALPYIRTRENNEPALKYRHLGIDKSAIDEKARTVEVSFSSETREVRAYDWDLGECPEILSHAEGACDLAPFLEAGSVLRNHKSDIPVAIPLDARIDAATRRGKAKIHFPEGDEDAERDWKKVRTGLVRGISVGYEVLTYEKVKPGQRSSQGHEGPCIVAVRWRVHEISLTPVPADSTVGVGRAKPVPAAGHLQGDVTMPVDPKVVRSMCRAAGLSEAFAEELVKRNLAAVEDVEKAILAERKSREKKTAQAGARNSRRESDTAVADEDDDDDEEDDEEETVAAPRSKSADKRERNARLQERERCVEIRAAVKLAKLGDDFADDLIDRGVSLNEARKLVLEEIGTRDAQQNSAASNGRGTAAGAHISVGDEQNEKHMRHMVVNLGRRAHASALTKSGKELNGVGDFEDDETKKIERSHVTLIGLVREYLRMIGIARARDMAPAEAVMAFFNPATKYRAAAANTGGDLANALSNLQNKSLSRGFLMAKPTWRSWCRKGILSDFKIAPWIQPTDFAGFRETGENGEILDSKLSDRAENRQLAIYARIVSLTLEMFVNDDLDALGRLPMLMGKSAAQLPSRLVYTHLLANPTMSDGDALFHANHGNLRSGGGSVLSATSLTTAVSDFRRQTAPKAPNDTEHPSEPIDIDPRILLVPPELEFTAYQLANPNMYVAETQFFKGKFQIEVEARLSNSGYTNYSATHWFLAGEGNETDSMEVSFLDGNENPITASWEDFDRLALRFRGWLACGAKALDWRGIHRNVGA